MRRTFLAVGCGLALAFGSAFAQQQHNQGPTLTEKAKEAAETIGEKTKAAVEKVKDLAHESAAKAKTGADEKSAKAGRGDAHSDKITEMQTRADADFRAARAKCDTIDGRAQKNICEKQAAVEHAHAELRIAKADAAAQSGKTSTMGAGKAAK